MFYIKTLIFLLKFFGYKFLNAFGYTALAMLTLGWQRLTNLQVNPVNPWIG